MELFLEYEKVHTEQIIAVLGDNLYFSANIYR